MEKLKWYFKCPYWCFFAKSGLFWKNSTESDTTHAFQGSECDIVFFSPVITKGMTDFLIEFAANSENLLNVALTRARTALHVVGDRKQCRDVGGILLSLSDHIEKIERRAKPRATIPSPAEIAFREILDRLDLSYREEYEVHRIDTGAPYRLDFMVTSPSGRRYDLEVDGQYHRGNERLQEDLVRTRFLESSGYIVLRFLASDVLHNPHAVEARLVRLG